MKTLNSILILITIVAVSIYAVTFTGCSDSVTSSTGTVKTYQARTESEFTNSNVKADPGSVVVVNLEDLHSKLDPLLFDTDLIGVDIIPFNYTETAEHKISIGDSSYFTISLINENTKQIIYELTPQNNHVTATIPAGDYLMIITSLEEYKEGDSSNSQVVFIQPDMEEAFNRGGGQRQVDFDPNQVNQLISNRRCSYCDLSNANLINAHLSSVVLFESNLTGANLTNAKLYGAKIIESNLDWANFRNANLLYVRIKNSSFNNGNFTKANLKSANIEDSFFMRANFFGANMHKTEFIRSRASHAVFDSTFLHDAKLQSADFTQGHFIYANLTGADLHKSIFNKTDLSYAKFNGAKLYGASFCDAIKIGITGDVVYTNNATQCWP